MFKNMKLSTKLAFGFGVILAALAIVGSTGLIKITGVQTVVADLSETHVPLLKVVSEVNVSAAEQELATTQYVLHMEKEYITKFDEIDKSADQKFEEIKALVTADQELVNEGWLDPVKKMAFQHDVFIKACRDLIEAVNVNKSFEERDRLVDDVTKQSATLMRHINEFLDMNDKETTAVAVLANKTTTSARMIIGVVGTIAIFAGIILAFIIARSITGPINRVIEGLNEGAAQVASASGQVSSASQGLAEGSSEQAASIEETSSALEEMSAMTKQNADNANQADNLMNEANQIVGKANDSMTSLITSMEEISRASEETSKIIKTIDEIAFQTNLLALNAAVEAARAGEAGAGFAVVADEVRNLAIRAAEAAGNTAELIEGTVNKVHDGGELVATTNDAFIEVAGSASKVGELLHEIAAASNEQAEGIEQVNKAVIEMDKVVQENAANAEESASASEEMSAQAEQMKSFVNDLVVLVGGQIQKATKFSTTKIRPQAAAARNTVTTPAQKKMIPRSREVSPEQLIPLDDDDFKDF